ncbi:MAG: hypothetical protein HKM95_02760 [Inquilinus sp.]|nr:hypothetical protein [Inquilinus sp.]
MSQRGYPYDDTMPGISLAIDPTAMRAMFADELMRTTGSDFTIDRCRLQRIRYRPAEHCFVHYALELVETRTGRRSEAWLTGVIYPGPRTLRRLEKLLAASAGQPRPEGWCRFEPGFYLPAADMLVQSFPFDRRLRSLPSVVAGTASEIDSLIIEGFGPGDWRIEMRRVEPVRYRALSGAVLRHTVDVVERESGRRDRRTCYVKVCRAGEGEQEARLLETLSAHARSTGQAFGVAELTGYLDQLDVVVVEQAPGDCFERMIIDGQDVAGAARRAARGLAAFHLGAMASHSVAGAVIDRANVAASYVAWACPDLADDLRHIVGMAKHHLETTELSPTHLDLKPDHFFLDGERVVFIDLNTFGAADPVLDVATLLARFAAMPTRFGAPAAHVETAAQALADEYFAQVPAEWRSRLDMNRAVAAVQVASEFFRHQHPDWRELVPAWIARARQAADAGSRAPRYGRRSDAAMPLVPVGGA